jgi:hypothetical protein
MQVALIARRETDAVDERVSRSTTPQDREGRWPRALPIALRCKQYTAVRTAEDKRVSDSTISRG